MCGVGDIVGVVDFVFSLQLLWFLAIVVLVVDDICCCCCYCQDLTRLAVVLGALKSFVPGKSLICKDHIYRIRAAGNSARLASFCSEMSERSLPISPERAYTEGIPLNHLLSTGVIENVKSSVIGYSVKATLRMKISYSPPIRQIIYPSSTPAHSSTTPSLHSHSHSEEKPDKRPSESSHFQSPYSTSSSVSVSYTQTSAIEDLSPTPAPHHSTDEKANAFSPSIPADMAYLAYSRQKSD